ncbi:hypothetical protein Pcinc_017046 [Petrolisthes cinctipes]|uniref:Ras-associating domain-containing protein n=1 Tax=Petrolisthes cinctipes TaxID=88211 RepID=A0AAE1KNX8_PETCI|nr:hypothetical protein Pcinc_017046 [Petrolisthes cinctipes]
MSKEEPIIVMEEFMQVVKEPPIHVVEPLEVVEEEGIQTTVRVWVRCLMQDMEYKTVAVAYSTTCRQLVQSILSKFRMKHRDPNLFYLTLELSVRKTGGVVVTSLALEDDSRPAELQSCHPRGDSRLALKMRPGGLVRVYDGALVPGSQYKSLLVSERTTSEELVKLVLNCNNIPHDPSTYCLYEMRGNDGRERRLQQDERPLRLISRWTNRDHCSLLVRPAPLTLTPALRASFHRSSMRRTISKKAPPKSAPSTPCNSSALLPSTTITISSNGASTVTINTTTTNIIDNDNNISTNNNKNTSNINDNGRGRTEDNTREEEEEVRPSPPLRSPRPIPPLRATARRQLPWTQSVDLVESAVDDDDSDGPKASLRTRRAHSYNDYENYFYI